MNLTLMHLCFSYGARPVLADVSFTAEGGSLTAVLGPNGVGKTTLFRCILGRQNRYQGKISLDGVDARSFSARELAHRVAYIPQLHGQTFSFSVIDMVLMGTTHAISVMSMPREKELRAAETAMERVGILHLRDKNFSQLSGGEQQLVLIARALAQEAKTLLMDEPTASLDYGNQSRVLQQARSLAKDGYTVLFTTHNPQHALTYADTAIALSGGALAAHGVPKAVLTPALIKQLYGVTVSLIQTDNGLMISPPIQEGCA